MMTSNMDFVRQEIENLKKLGESWNMEKYQIEEAIMKALADKNGNVTPEVLDSSLHKKRAKCGCFKSCLMLCLFITIGIFSAGIFGACLYTNFSPFELYVNSVVSDLQYPVMRRWRLLSLPLHSYFDLHYLAVKECLINNPWYIPEEPDCGACEDVADIPQLNNLTDFHNVYAGWGNPIIITDVIPYAEKKYTVDSFFEYYQSHSNELDQDTCEVSYPDNSVQTIGDYWKLLGKLGPEAPSIWWKLCYGEGLRAIRKLLPRPYFISTEGALEKILIFVNSDTDVLSLPQGQYGNAWLAQVTGATEMELKPIPDCNTTCPDLNVTLSKGQVMYLNLDLWDVDIFGKSSVDEPGILLLSTFA